MTERTALWTRSFISVTFINVMLFFAWQLLMPTLPLFLSDIHATTSEIGISISTNACGLAENWGSGQV